MAAITNIDLRKARDDRDFTREQLADMVHVSASTIENWERGISTPNPDDVDNVARALGHPTLWHDWMMSHYTSYARRHRDMKPYALPAAVLSTRHEISDVMALQDQLERDALDGKIDDPALKAKCLKEISEMVTSGLRMLELLNNPDTGE